MNLFKNAKTRTLGGKQFWTDHLWRDGWRVQQHAISGHWRLLDAKDRRWVWGTRQECIECLDAQLGHSSEPERSMVILLHGLVRSAASMKPLGEAIQRELGLQPVYFGYASTRASIAQHAQALADVIEGLPKSASLSFVGHSLGNIVSRYYFGMLIRDRRDDQLSRIRSMVMLGPPNQGASFARQLDRVGMLSWITGKSGVELGPGWQELKKDLAIPPCPFGIIAGSLPHSTFFNPLIEGPGDLVVTAEETFLEGAADRLELPRLHTFLMSCPEVQAATVQFLRTHRFKSE
jgi:hypothetical protein